jgi:hypothetical protein
MASGTVEILEVHRVGHPVTIHLPIRQSLGAFLLAGIEAVCVFYVSTAKVGLVVASAAIGASSWATFLHRDIFRIPTLAVASFGAILNLFLLWRAQRLRNAPSAAWRKRPLSRKEKARAMSVIFLSVLTLVITAAEIWIHRALHSSAL